MKYQIGDVVWYAARTEQEKTMECPDCCGKKFLTVIFGDDSRVTIDCITCSRGYEPPKGYVTYTTQKSSTRQVGIERMEIGCGEEKYGFGSCYLADATELFDTEEEAEKRAVELAIEQEKAELARINMKGERHRTWAWNATYHRKCIKDAKKSIAYHEAKLDAAKKHQGVADE